MHVFPADQPQLTTRQPAGLGCLGQELDTFLVTVIRSHASWGGEVVLRVACYV